MSWHEVNNDTVHDDLNIKGFVDNYRWLSNFYPCKVLFKGLAFNSAENAYQAAKSLDPEVWKEFVPLSPAQAKKKGREIEMREDWDKVKLGIMCDILVDKFHRNRDLRNKLLGTGDKYLEETNWWGDRYWGVCKGVGENHLGGLLMKVRDQLKGVKDDNS